MRTLGAGILEVRHKQIDLPAPVVDSGNQQSTHRKDNDWRLSVMEAHMQLDTGNQGVAGPPTALGRNSKGS